MREKFELCCKVVGLILFCWGLIAALKMVPIYFHQPQAEIFIPPSMWNTFLGQEMLQDLEYSMPRLFGWITVQLLLQGIVPALLGIYLMRSGHLFVWLCYPHRVPVQSGSSGDPPVDGPLPVDGRGSDERYAPPGYYP